MQIIESDYINVQKKHQARCISQKMRNYTFLCSVVIWYEILSNVNIVSKILQGVSINFLVAVEHLNKLKETKGAYRTDEYFGLILKEASQLTQSLGIENTFTSEDAFRRRKRKKQFDYENKINPENNFKINSFSLY